MRGKDHGSVNERTAGFQAIDPASAAVESPRWARFEGIDQKLQIDPRSAYSTYSTVHMVHTSSSTTAQPPFKYLAPSTAAELPL
jgi:purine nucleoside permease